MSTQPMISLPDFFQPVVNPTYSDWVEKDCDGTIDRATAYMPLEFESYVHLCHPFRRYPDNSDTEEYRNLPLSERVKQIIPVRWEDATSARKLHFNGVSVWRDINWNLDYRPQTPGELVIPVAGVPTVDVLHTIEEAVLKITNKDEMCVCAFRNTHRRFKFPPTEALFSYGQGPYFLMQGTLEKVFAYWVGQIVSEYGTARYTSPQAIWSSNRDWCYAVPHDAYSSLFGGPDSITREIVKANEVEAYPLPDIESFRF